MLSQLLSLVLLCGFTHGAGHVDWMSLGQNELSKILSLEKNENVAKNVILFIGDGMGVSTVTAARAYSRQMKKMKEDEVFSFEKFPYVALSKTYNTDGLVADSAGTATAMMCGVKTNVGVIGVNEHVMRGDCSQVPGNEVNSILDWAQVKGKSTGIVTTTRVTHATPAASYAHTAERSLQSDADTKPNITGKCEDIALQLITQNSGINVILGGGRINLMPNTTLDPEYGTEPNATYGRRLDGRDLIQEWLDEKQRQGLSHSYVWNQSAFDRVDPQKTDYLLGLFEPSDMQYEYYREPNDTAGEPSITEMVEKAIKILSKNKNGFFLMVEGGRIDHAHHETRAKLAFHDTLVFAEAVERAVSLTNQEDSLIVVTADHSHVFTIAGYPSLDNDILGVNDKAVSLDGDPYLTLSYANGPNAGLANFSAMDVDFHDPAFQQPSLVPLESETHGGEDVAIYAQGPMAHLFMGVQEQSYIAHAMAYAACLGPNQKHCDEKKNPANHSTALHGGATWLPYGIIISVITTTLLLLKH